MHRYPLFLVVFLLLSNSFLPQQVFACGYNFVSDCSTNTRLFINGTPLDLQVAGNCGYGYEFNGWQIGDIQSLYLGGASAFTWESCQNNVSKMILQYRIYREGDTGELWQEAQLELDSFYVGNPYTARYFGLHSNVNLMEGFLPGLNYVLELRFKAEVDTIGDDMIAETYMLQENNGENYRLNFRYGGAAAPSFWATPLQVQSPTCPGNNNGFILIKAFGNTNGIKYSWSNTPLNQAEIYNLSAGNYSVTISNTNGTAQVLSIPVTDPSPMTIVPELVRPLTCTDGGWAAIKTKGGRPPYSYEWSTGSVVSSTFVSSAGLLQVTVTDANQCKKSGFVSVPDAGPITQLIEKSICPGEIFKKGLYTFLDPGIFNFTVAGENGACDTTFSLNLKRLQPDLSLQGIPLSYNFSSCIEIQSAKLCATPSVFSTKFTWKKGDLIAGINPCFSGLSGNQYVVSAQITNDGRSCYAEKNIAFIAKQTEFDATINGIIEPEYCNPFGPVSVILTAQTDAKNPTFEWVYNGITIANTASCTFTVTEWQPPFPILPILTVHDENGCQAVAKSEVIVFQPSPYAVNFDLTNASANNSNDGRIFAKITGGIEPYKLKWTDGTTSPELNNLKPGEYCLTVTDGNDCTRVKCAEIKAVSSTDGPNETDLFLLLPNPVRVGEVFVIRPSAQKNLNDWQIEILDQTGKTLMRNFEKSTQEGCFLTIPTGFSEGLYMVKWSNGLQTTIKRFIVVR